MAGLVHLYCGDGKGKTTAALGLALRAAGRGTRVLAARFLKNDDSGELPALKQVRGIEIFPCEKTFGFTWQMTEAQREEARIYYSGLLEQAWSRAVWLASLPEKQARLTQAPAALLVLDEAVGACRLGFLAQDRLLTLLASRPSGLEVVLTGREPSEALCAAADYITEMIMRRHPYEQGIAARPGIEY